jgi:thioredoxin reductase (NADPH)
MAKDHFDVIVIGGGPCGLTAGMYCSRARLRTALIERGLPGGQIASTEMVENYLGFPDQPTGHELAAVMERHATAFGLEFHGFTSVYAVNKDPDGHWNVQCDEGDLHGKAVIVATGAAPKKLGVPGENEYAGRGVSYCATCDGAFFRDKKVLVIGGGDSAVEEGMFLTRFASKVTIVHRRDKLRAEAIVQERAFANPKIDFAWNSVITEIRGNGSVSSALLENVVDKSVTEVACDGVFMYVGTTPATAMVGHLLELDDCGYIVTDEHLATSEPGIFAAGDCRKNLYKQIIIAAGEGATAALSATHWIERNF